MSAPHPSPAATSERSAEPTPDTADADADAETMKAIVQDEYGTAPEEVLRLAEIARPETAPTRSSSGCVPPAWTGARGI